MGMGKKSDREKKKFWGKWASIYVPNSGLVAKFVTVEVTLKEIATDKNPLWNE